MRPEKGFAVDAHVVVTTREDGDQRPLQRETASDVARERGDRAPVTVGTGDVPWSFVHQVHECTVIGIDEPEGPLAIEADGLVTNAPNVPLVVLGADCSLIALASPEGVVAAVHAGWRGLLSGVMEASVQAMRDRGARSVEAVIGPTIGPECYEFSPADLEPLVKRYGEPLRRKRSDGTFALDLVAGVTAALSTSGVEAISRLGGCTACDKCFYSWRARRDDKRHALVVWREGSE